MYHQGGNVMMGQSKNQMMHSPPNYVGSKNQLVD